MNKRLQGFFAGILMGVIITSGFVFAEDISKTINAVYMNVKLVVDGIQIEPKDANGNYVEPFIYNGTTYLPVRAVGEAFGKDVSWDGDTATVYIGGEVKKPAKDVLFSEKPYIECSNAGEFDGGKSFGNDIHNYIGFIISPYGRKDKTLLDNGRCRAESYVVYPLNGLAKKVKGSFIAPRESSWRPETQMKFYDESGKLLYQSPIMIPSTAPIDFEFDVTGCINLKVEGIATTGNSYSDTYCMISDFTIVTTDY